jgi:hypothetical protein
VPAGSSRPLLVDATAYGDEKLPSLLGVNPLSESSILAVTRHGCATTNNPDADTSDTLLAEIKVNCRNYRNSAQRENRLETPRKDNVLSVWVGFIVTRG